MYTMIAGVAVKIILNYILIGTKGIDIHGGPYASIACYSIVMITNLFFVCKYTDMRFNVKEWVIRPGLAAFCMGIIVYLLQRFLPFNRITTILEILAGILVYIFAAYRLKALSADDVRAMLRRKGKAT